MQPIFTLQYCEYMVAQELSKGASVFIPLSAQEKGIDMVIYNKFKSKSNKFKTIQVKSARDFIETDKDKLDKKKVFHHNSLFNKITVQRNADWYILIVMYPKENKFVKAKNTKWLPMLLAFKNKEIDSLMKKLRCKNGKLDTKFVIGFDDANDIYMTRGLNIGLSKYLFEKRRKEIFKF